MNELARWTVGYLVNAAWQVPLVFALGWLASRLARRVSVHAEHRVWVGALLLQAILPGVRLPWNTLARGAGEAWLLVIHLLGGIGPEGAAAITVTTGPGALRQELHFPPALTTSIALIYGGVTLYFAARLAWGVRRTLRMRRDSMAMALTGDAADGWRRYSRMFGCDGATLAVTEAVPGPVTIGGRRGVLLVPPDFLERVTDGDWKAVAAHEFAHLRRRDFLKNLLYEVLTVPVTFHPLLWRTRAQMRESREMVCDRMAADAVAGADWYARSLLRLAALVAQSAPANTLHAIGIFDANLFERRIMKLTERRMEVRGVRRIGLLAACVGMAVATGASATALRLEVPVAQSDPGARGPARVSGGVMAGNVLTKVAPIYPPEAKEQKVQGAVVLSAVIGRDGTVENLQVVSGPEALRSSALDSVRQWTYKPYLLNGQPVEVQTTITVNYSFAQ